MKGASRWVAAWLLVLASCGGGGSGGARQSMPSGTPSTVGLDYQYKTMVEDCALAHGGGWHCGELAFFTISRGEHLELSPWALRRACALGDFETCFKGVTAAGDTKRLELLTPELADQACRQPKPAIPEAECRQAFAVQVASATPKTPEEQAALDEQANRDYEAWKAREAEYASRPRSERLATASAECAAGNVVSCDKVTFFARGRDPDNDKVNFQIFRQREGTPSADRQRACRQWYEEELTRSIEPRLAKWAKRCAKVRPSSDGDSEIQLPAPFGAHVAYQCRAVAESQYTREATRVVGGEIRTGTETVTVGAHTVCAAAGVTPESHASSMAPVQAYCQRPDAMPPMSSQDEQRRKWFAGSGVVPGCSERYLQR